MQIESSQLKRPFPSETVVSNLERSKDSCQIYGIVFAIDTKLLALRHFPASEPTFLSRKS